VEYARLADAYLDTERYEDFCDSRLRHLDEIVLEYVEGPEFDRLLVDTVQAQFPAHEHDRFVPHFRGLLALWARDERRRLSGSAG
jgi:hypothetical protein